MSMLFMDLKLRGFEFEHVTTHKILIQHKCKRQSDIHVLSKMKGVHYRNKHHF